MSVGTVSPSLACTSKKFSTIGLKQRGATMNVPDPLLKSGSAESLAGASKAWAHGGDQHNCGRSAQLRISKAKPARRKRATAASKQVCHVTVEVL